MGQYRRDNWVPQSGQDLAEYLRGLRLKRRAGKAARKSSPARRVPLSPSEREEVLDKTGGRCHVCGGEILGKWQADHVLSHSGGGEHVIGNYLPAHPVCNNYRWDYGAEEFQEILRLGVWLRSQIEKDTRLGREAADSFVRYEARRIARHRR